METTNEAQAKQITQLRNRVEQLELQMCKLLQQYAELCNYIRDHQRDEFAHNL